MWVADRLINLVTGLGTSKDKTIASAWAVEEITPQQALAAYRSDWIARKVVDIPAFDMIREGRNWQAKDDQIEKLEAEEARLQVWPKLAKALKLARLFGGSALILGTGDTNTEEPLSPSAIQAGGLKFIHVVSRYEITEGEIERDPASPGWGEPKSYSMAMQAGGALKLHPSRVIPFVSSDQMDPYQITVWGDSILQVLDEAVKNAGLTASGIAQLVTEAKVDVFKIPDFLANVGDQAYRDKIVTRVRLANTAKSSTNALLMDAAEDYVQKTINFSQLPEVMRLYLQIAAGAADIPATRLLGQSPDGMNATGEGDLRNYYDRLAADQKVSLRPRLSRLDEVLIPSALGSRPAEIHFAFAPLWQLGEVEKSAVRKQDADTAKIYVDSGLVPTVALAKSVQNQLVEQGSYPGLEGSLNETKATVGLGTEMLKTLVAAWQGGAAPLEVLHGRMAAAGMLPANLTTFEAFSSAIEDQGGGLSSPDVPDDDEQDEDTPDPVIGDAAPRTLYVSRKLLNAADLIAWAKEQGFETTLPADDMHVTIAFSRTPVDWMKVGETWNNDKDGQITVAPGGARLVEKLGDKGAVVLLFGSSELSWRHESIRREAGASWDYPEYQPHVSITYSGSDLDLKAVEPYRGKLVFGPEIFAELDEDWSAGIVEA